MMSKSGGDDQESDSEDEMGEERKMQRCRWLVSGGKDHRVAIWVLMSFENSGVL